MEKNIITTIQYICSQSNQRGTSQRIFRCINKGALSIACKLFQDFMNRLEIDSRIYKTRGVKMRYSLLTPFPQTATKMMGRIP